jgi:AraC-like DNA-binding protein
MAPDKADSRILRFSTADLPEGERLPFWREFFAREIVHADVEPQADCSLQAEAIVLELPRLGVLWTKETPMRYSRSRSQAADGDDSVVVLIRKNGFSTLSQGGREVSLGMGDGVAFLGAEPACATVSEVECLAVVSPRAVLTPMLGDVASRTMRHIPRNCEALRLLSAYAEVLRENFGLTAPELRHVVATHMHDLVAMALGPTRDGAELANKRGLRAARRKAIVADMLASAGDLDLTATTMARRHGFSPRYIHKLFEAEGSTFSELLLTVRLVRAHHMLTDPRFASLPITAIALSSAFGDLSHFNHTFRRRFGATPTEVRHAAQHGKEMD